MHNRTKLLAGYLVVGLLGHVGCSKAPTYDVGVKNATSSLLSEIEVKFDDGSWEWVFGVSGAGKGALYSGINGMPPVPPSVTIKWSDEPGKQHSVVVKIPESVRAQTAKRGELQFTIENNDSVTLTFNEW